MPAIIVHMKERENEKQNSQSAFAVALSFNIHAAAQSLRLDRNSLPKKLT